MLLHMQGGRLNCLQCAARYGRTELFHHLVQKYGFDPKEKDCYNGVRNALYVLVCRVGEGKELWYVCRYRKVEFLCES